jgi:hypothetical protein
MIHDLLGGEDCDERQVWDGSACSDWRGESVGAYEYKVEWAGEIAPRRADVGERRHEKVVRVNSGE